MLVLVRLKHDADSGWGLRVYLDVPLLDESSCRWLRQFAQ